MLASPCILVTRSCNLVANWATVSFNNQMEPNGSQDEARMKIGNCCKSGRRSCLQQILLRAEQDQLVSSWCHPVNSPPLCFFFSWRQILQWQGARSTSHQLTDYLRHILERRRTRWFHWTGTHIDKKQNKVNLCPVDPSQLLPPILLVICDKYIGKEENQSTRPFLYLRQTLKRSKSRWWKISIREMTVKPVRSPTCANWGSFLSMFTFGKIR